MRRWNVPSAISHLWTASTAVYIPIRSIQPTFERIVKEPTVQTIVSRTVADAFNKSHVIQDFNKSISEAEQQIAEITVRRIMGVVPPETAKRLLFIYMAAIDELKRRKKDELKRMARKLLP